MRQHHGESMRRSAKRGGRERGERRELIISEYVYLAERRGISPFPVIIEVCKRFREFPRIILSGIGDEREVSISPRNWKTPAARLDHARPKLCSVDIVSRISFRRALRFILAVPRLIELLIIPEHTRSHARSISANI